MKKIIINLLVVLLVINPYFTPVYAENNEEIVDTAEQIEEIFQTEEGLVEDEVSETIEEEPVLPIEETNNNEETSKELIKPTEIEEPRLNKAEQQNELTLDQDDDGNLTLTSDNSEFFDSINKNSYLTIYYYDSLESNYAINSIGVSNSESGNYNNNVFFDTNQGFEVIEDNGSEYIFISAEHCKAEHIGSGFIAIQINSKISNKIEFNSAVKKLDKEIIAYEDVENRRFVIECEDKDFLKALLYPCWNYTDEDGVYKDSWLVSYLDFTHDIGDDCMQNHQPNIDKIYEDIIYDEQNELIYISEEVFKARHVPNGITSFDAYAYGYEEERDINFSPISTIGCETAPDDINAYQNAEGDLIIESDDKNYLQSLFQKKTSSKIWNIFGGEISLVDSNGVWHSFSSEGNANFYFDEQKQCICIPYISLVSTSNPIQIGYLSSVIISSYGYEKPDMYYEPNELPITKGAQEAPNDITIEEDLDGNILIHSEDIDFLRALVIPRSNNSNGNGSRIEIENNNTWHWISNWETSSDKSLTLNEQEKIVTVSHNSIIDSNIGKGLHNVDILALGYSSYSTTIELSHACESVTEVVADVNTNSDLIITCEDTEWIETLASGNGRIEFYKNNIWTNSLYSYENDPFIISNGGKTLTISNEKIANNSISADTYSLRFYVNGYVSLYLNEKIIITKGAKTIDPSTITVSYDTKNEIIKITSSNRDFIEKLAAYEVYHYGTTAKPNLNKAGGGAGIGSDGYGYISFDNNEIDCYAYFSNCKQYYNGKIEYQREDLKLSSDHKTITIPKTSIYGQGLARNCSYVVNLHAKGYKQIQLTIDNLKVGVNPDLPDDISVSFEDNVGLIITTNDSDWLKGIDPKKDSYVSIGFIRYQNGRGYFGFDYIKEDGKIIVPIESLYRESNLDTRDDYRVIIRSYGYRTYISEQNIHITGVKEVTSPVTIKQGEGILIFNSEDKDYLRALAKKYSTLYVHYTDYDCAVYQAGYESICYDEIGGYTYTNMNTVLACLNGHKENGHDVDFDNLHMRIEAFGYEGIELDYQLKFIECEDTEVVAGTTEQLSFADFDESKVTWSSSNEAIATIDDDGVLKGEKVGKATITAKYTADDGSETYDSIDVKITSNTKVSLKLQTVDKNTLATVGIPEQLDLTVKNYSLTENDVVTYTSSDTNVASVDENGLLEFLKPGKVTITAEAVNKKATLALSVYNYDKTLKVSLTSSEKFLEINDASLDVLTFKAGNEEISTSDTTYTSSNASVISVDENGLLTAHKKGTAKITAAITDDPSNRKATVTVQVVDTIVRSIRKELNVDDNDVIESNTNPITDDDVRVILMNYADLDKTTKLHINIENCGKDKFDNNMTPAKVSYVSTDSSVASVDKNGYVTFKKAGQVTITVTVASNPKGYEVVSKDIIFKAIDYTPRIESNRIAINKYLNTYPELNLYKILGTSISDFKITETNGVESDLFIIEHIQSPGSNTDIFKIKFKDENNKKNVAPKAYSQYIHFKVDDNWCKFKVTVVVASNMPTVTPKVTGFYNIFTGENTLSLSNTVKNGEITGVEFVDNWANYDALTGIITPYIGANGKPTATSGKVRYTFDGYTTDGYVEKTIKLPTKATKPTVKLETSTYTLYVPEGTTGNKDIKVKLIDGNKNVIKEGTVTLKDTLSIANLTLDNDGFDSDGTLKVSIPVENLKSGKVVLDYKGNGWADNSSIPLTVNIKVSKSLPKAKLSTTTVNLNYYLHSSDTVDIYLPNSSEKIAAVDFQDYKSTSVNDVNPSFDPDTGKITVEPLEPGNYSIVCIPYLDESKEIALSPLTLSIKETDSLPKMKFKNSTLEFNKAYYENGISTAFTLSNNTFDVTAGYPVFENLVSATGGPMEGMNPIVQGFFDDGVLHLYLSETAKHVSPGKYKISVTPHYYVNNQNCNEGDVAGAPVIITVNIHNNAPTVTLTSRDTINPFDINSSSLINIKLNNLVDKIKAIDIDSDIFEAEKVNDDFYLKIKDNADFSNIKDQTLTINALVKTNLCNEGISSTIKVKLVRKAPKVKLTTPTVNVYDTTVAENTIVGDTVIDFDYDNYLIDISNCEIDNNGTVATDDDYPILAKSLGYKVEYDKTNQKLIVKMIDGAKIKSGSTHSFSINLIWKNDYVNNGRYTKTTTIKLNVKDMSYSNAADSKEWYELPNCSIFIQNYSENSYDETVSNLKEFFKGKYTKVTYKAVESDKEVGQIISVKVNGQKNYATGQYAPTVPIVIEICKKKVE